MIEENYNQLESLKCHITISCIFFMLIHIHKPFTKTESYSHFKNWKINRSRELSRNGDVLPGWSIVFCKKRWDSRNLFRNYFWAMRNKSIAAVEWDRNATPWIGWYQKSGTIRNNFEGKKVISLEYEAYLPMAENEVRKIYSDIRQKWPVKHIAVFHRLGYDFLY